MLCCFLMLCEVLRGSKGVWDAGPSAWHRGSAGRYLHTGSICIMSMDVSVRRVVMPHWSAIVLSEVVGWARWGKEGLVGAGGIQ
jgi:hypothetical protein